MVLLLGHPASYPRPISRCRFFIDAAEIELPLVLEVKGLSTEQLVVMLVLWSIATESSDKDGIIIIFVASKKGTLVLLETLMASSDSSSLAASRPAKVAACSSKALQAFSRIECRYFPCASILSWSLRCTCPYYKGYDHWVHSQGWFVWIFKF